MSDPRSTPNPQRPPTNTTPPTNGDQMIQDRTKTIMATIPASATSRIRFPGPSHPNSFDGTMIH